MTVQLLIAPCASGKTQTCIDRIQEIKSGHPLSPLWVIVPDRLQAAAFRRRLAGIGGFLGVQVARFDDLFQNLLDQAGTYVPRASLPMLHRLIQETVDEAVNDHQLPYFAPLQPFPGFIQILKDAFADLKRSMITPQKLLDHTQNGPPAQKDLALLYYRYQDRLQKLHWADGEEMAWLAIRRLQEDHSAATAIQLLVVDGFDSFNCTQLQALKLLSGQVGELLITLPGSPDCERLAHRRFAKSIQWISSELHPEVITLQIPVFLPGPARHLEGQLFEAMVSEPAHTDEPLFLEARSPADEAREALRWIKKLIVRCDIGLSECAIFTPNPRLYHPLLRIFAEEFGIPIRFTLDEPLESSPAITALINLLTLPVRNFNSRYLVNVLRSPYFAFSIDAETVDTLERVSRVAQIVEGQDQWEDAWERLIGSTEQEQLDLDDERNAPKLPRGSEAAALGQTLRAIFEIITPPNQERSQAGWVTWLEDLLETLQFFKRADSDRDQPACEVLVESLRALVQSDSVFGKSMLDYASFISSLQGNLKMEGFRESRLSGQPALWVGRMTDARGTRFQAVAVLGLSEGSFPEVERPDPFLDENLRQSLDMELRLQREQAGLFYQAVTRADQHLLLTRPYLSDDGEAWEPSAYWKAAASLFDQSVTIKVNPESPRPLGDCASTQELLFSAVRKRSLPHKFDFLEDDWQQLRHAQALLQARRNKAAQGPYEGYVESAAPAVQQRYSFPVPWSASKLETYGKCPFQFFTSDALGLEKRELPKLGLDARQLGSMLHKILEETYRQATDPTDLEVLLASLMTEAEKVFATAPGVYGFRPSALWDIEKAQLLACLKNNLSAMTADASWTPIKFEVLFGSKGADPLVVDVGDKKMIIRGVIDRVDHNEKGQIRVIDYKTGGSDLKKALLEKGAILQLPVYAMAARDALGLGMPVDGFYWRILEAKPAPLILAKYKNEQGEGVEAAIQVARQQLLRILNGIQAGEFPPQPPDGGCPSYCPAAVWCWRYEAGW